MSNYKEIRSNFILVTECEVQFVKLFISDKHAMKTNLSLIILIFELDNFLVLNIFLFYLDKVYL